MKTALIQSSLSWENPLQNRTFFEQKINAISENIDLIVLPEMFTSGFTMNPKSVAETLTGDTVSWLKQTAKTKNSAITGSLVIEEKGNYYNRLVFVFPTGELQYYDKRHLFTLAGEDKVYTAGNQKKQICYDLRFPVFSRNVENYDVLIYVASWPKPRINAWDILLKARAVENMSYVIGVNRIGIDDNNLEYTGHSQAIDFLGNNLIEPQEKEGVFIVEMDKKILLETREKLAFLNDMDNFQILND
jgi:omega-amidase